MFLKRFSKYLIVILFSLNLVNIFSMNERNFVIFQCENEPEYILVRDIFCDLSIKIANTLYTDKDDIKIAESNFDKIFKNFIKESYKELAQIFIDSDENKIKIFSKTLLDYLCTYVNQDDDRYANIQTDIKNNFFEILNLLEKEFNFKPVGFISENDVKFEAFKDLIERLSLKISKSLILNDEEKKTAYYDIYGIFFDVLKDSYIEIIDRAYLGKDKDIESLSTLLLSVIYQDCDTFAKKYISSDDDIINNTIQTINFLINRIKLNEQDVLEKIKLVLMKFRKKPLLERIGYYVEKVRKGVAIGSGTILVLLAPALIGGTKKAFTFTIIEYSGGVFICTTIVPKLFKKISSLLD